jgi:hypothetical protein
VKQFVTNNAVLAGELVVTIMEPEKLKRIGKSNQLSHWQKSSKWEKL